MSDFNIQTLLKKEMTRKEFVAFGAFAVAAVFGVVGLIKTLASHAATPTASLEPEDGTVVAPATKVVDSSASSGDAIQFGTPGTGQTFVLGTTRPTLANPDVPTANDNVGAAFGWNGITLQVMNGDQTIPAGTTWENRLIHGLVTFGAGATLKNSVIDGRAITTYKGSGLVMGSGGGTLDRVTIRNSVAGQMNYMNGLHINSGTTGNWIQNRCHISRVVDAVHVSHSGYIKMTGCRVHDFAFFNDDPAQSDPTQLNPGWTHNDIIQRLAGTGNGDWVEGCSMEAFFDTTGVTWSGGSWGSGTASGGLIGMPSVALNGGYWNQWGKGNWSNLITYSNIAPYTGMTFINNWFDGANHPSGMVQMTKPGVHSFRLDGNRWGLGGHPSAAKKLFLATYDSSSTVIHVGNIYDSIADVPTSLRGQPLTFTAGGASVILP